MSQFGLFVTLNGMTPSAKFLAGVARPTRGHYIAAGCAGGYITYYCTTGHGLRQVVNSGLTIKLRYAIMLHRDLLETYQQSGLSDTPSQVSRRATHPTPAKAEGWVSLF